MLSELLKTYLEIAVGEEPGDTTGGGTPTETDPPAEPEGGQETPPELEEPTFELDGEKLTAKQIKEFRQGYLRQSDYTKKTQELAAQKNQYKEAVDLYEYFRANPQLAQKLSELEDEGTAGINKVYNPQDEKLTQIDIKLKSMEIDHQLEMLKLKDPNLNEVELLNLANQKVIPLEDAYVMLRGMNFDKLLKEQLDKQSANLTEQIKKGNAQVTTLMNPNDKANNTGTYGLTKAEMEMADKLFDGDYAEYAKWK